MNSVVALVGPESLSGERYPRELVVGRRRIVIELMRAAQVATANVDGVICHSTALDDVEASLGVGARTALGVDSIAALLDAGASELLGRGGWIPVLPLAHAIEIRKAQELIEQGSLGRCRSVRLQTYVGAPDHPTWDLDSTGAGTPFEAAAFGIDLLQRLFGDTVSSTTWIRTPDDPWPAAIHGLGDDRFAFHELPPASMSASPAFRADVECDAGRLLLRHEFGPGAVMMWRARPPGFVAPALEVPRDNIQAPDTVAGGWENAGLLRRLLDASQVERPAADQAVDIVAHLCESVARRR